jgi:hypothetical protein
MQDNHRYSELREKIIAGAKLAYKRLVEKAKLNDEYLIFSENGKIIKVKARSIKY